MGAWRSVTRTLLLITLSAPLTVACSDELAEGNGTVGETEIRFATGVVSANTADGSRAATRANYNTIAYTFSPLTLGTKVHIKTEGTWTGHDPVAVTHYTKTGTAETAVDGKSPISGVGIFWDDYGMGDPANKETGRADGLNVYAACVDGYNASAIGTIADWESLTWTLPADQSATATWKAKDLLVSNNKSDNANTDNAAQMNKDKSGRYKFDTQLAGTACNLELHHAMSKITVNLKAGDGFPVNGEDVPYFENSPSVTLTKLNLKGTVNVKTMTVTPAAPPVSDNTQLAKAATATTDYTATYEGLIIPGNAVIADYCDKETHDGSALQIRGVAQINCDGNIFNIYANELMDAMNTADADYIFHSGKNYILNITVNKTEIEVTATVTDWVNVEADPVEPTIEVTTSLGDKGAKDDGFKQFKFYMRTDDDTNYDIYGGTATGTSADGTTPWSFTNQIYWPSHDIHYHMRGVYPTSTTVTANKIAVANSTYNATTSPSNLMVGAPELAANTMCDNASHTAVDMSLHGICAREATINLNFRYMMSQVEVHLTTPPSGSDVVNLTNATVEIVNAYTTGSVDIHSRTMEISNISNYLVEHATDENVNWRHAAVVPQNLTNATGDLIFKITIRNTDGTTDVYIKPIKDILVSENGGAAASITKWDAGKHYTYTLNMRKTEIKVTATLTDWVSAEANQEIWF